MTDPTITPERLAEIERQLGEITRWPWAVSLDPTRCAYWLFPDGGGEGLAEIYDGNEINDPEPENAPFIARAPQTISDLIAAVRASQARESALREALESIAESRDAGRHDGKPEPCPARDGYDMWLIARSALTPTESKEPNT